MKYEDFVTQVKECIWEKQGKEVRIYVNRIVRNNGERKNSLSVLSQGENFSPAIDLEPYYRLADRGIPIRCIADQILTHLRQYKMSGVLDVSFFSDYGKAADRIVCRLVHYEKNRELLQNVPHVRFQDLAVVYYYDLKDVLFSNASIMIQNTHLELWKVTREEIHAKALENTPKIMPCEFGSMASVIQEITGTQTLSEEDIPGRYMYVLTNREKFYGAVNMIFSDTLGKIAESLREDYYILPGSIHECIIVPVSAGMTAKKLQEMVKEVNQTQVEPEDFLSDSVYRYYHTNRSLVIAAQG